MSLERAIDDANRRKHPRGTSNRRIPARYLNHDPQSINLNLG